MATRYLAPSVVLALVLAPAAAAQGVRDSMFSRAAALIGPNPAGAKAIMDSLIALDSMYDGAHAVRAHARWRLRDLAGAEADFTVAIRLSRQQQYWAERGRVRAEMGHPGARSDSLRAEEESRRTRVFIEESRPGGRLAEANRLFDRADSLAKVWDTTAARITFDSAIALDPDRPAGLYDRGMFLWRQGDAAGAKRDVTRAADLGDERARYFIYGDGKQLWNRPPITQAERDSMRSVERARAALDAAEAERVRLAQQPPVAAPPFPWRNAVAIVAALLLLTFAGFYVLYVATPTTGIVRVELPEGEERLWSGMSKQGILLGRKHLTALVVGAVSLGVAVSFLPAATAVFTRGKTEWGLAVVFVAMAGVSGLYALGGFVFHDAWMRKRTTYVLTDQRVLTLSGTRTRSYPLDVIEWVRLERHADGTGTVLYMTPREFGESSRRRQPRQLAYLADAAAVHARLQEARSRGLAARSSP